MSLARIIGKLEGWKYTPLHSIVLPEGKIRDGQKFDNHGDQYICDRADALETIHVKSGDHTIIVEEQGKAAIKAQEITVEQNASLLHIRILNDGTRPYFAPVHASIARDGLYTQLTLTHGGTLMRLATQAELNGENAKADIRAIHKVSDENHIDQTILIKHMAPHCESNQNVRYVVDGEARAAFQGKIFVDQIAQKTMAYQLCKSLLLSDAAQMNTKPELEIYADDVKCSHGATTGALDEKAMFYLRSRGVPKDEAQKLLMQAFVENVLEGLDLPENVQAMIESYLS